MPLRRTCTAAPCSRLTPILEDVFASHGAIPLGDYKAKRRPTDSASSTTLVQWVRPLTALLEVAPSGLISFVSLREAAHSFLLSHTHADPFRRRGQAGDLFASAEKVSTSIRCMLAHLTRMQRSPSRLRQATARLNRDSEKTKLQALVDSLVLDAEPVRGDDTTEECEVLALSDDAADKPAAPRALGRNQSIVSVDSESVIASQPDCVSVVEYTPAPRVEKEALETPRVTFAMARSAARKKSAMKRPASADLPDGWTCEVRTRGLGRSVGQRDCDYKNAQGHTFRSMREVRRFLGMAPGLADSQADTSMECVQRYACMCPIWTRIDCAFVLRRQRR